MTSQPYPPMRYLPCGAAAKNRFIAPLVGLQVTERYPAHFRDRPHLVDRLRNDREQSARAWRDIGADCLDGKAELAPKRCYERSNSARRIAKTVGKTGILSDVRVASAGPSQKQQSVPT